MAATASATSQIPLPAKRPSRRANTSGQGSAFVIKRRFDENRLEFKPLKPKVERPRHGPRDLVIKTDTNPTVAPIPIARRNSDDEDYILVMGSSGAGKTSFINVASGSRLPVSGGLKSCTSDVSFSDSFVLDGRRIRLIDTPGFDDSNKSDADVLGTISNFLAQEFIKGRRLQGILYFHRISDVRMGALSKRNFTMFQKLCGEHAYPNVVLVTSRWSEVNEHVGTARESELKSKANFFKPILDAGASLRRYERNIESAQTIIRQVLDRPSVTLMIQKEMVLERKAVGETEAGLSLQKEKLSSIQKFQENLKGLAQEIEMVKQENDVEMQKELEADAQELKKKMQILEEENRKLLAVERQKSEPWEVLPPASEIPYIPSEASTAVPAEMPSIPSAISRASQKLTVAIASSMPLDEAEPSPCVIGGIASSQWRETDTTAEVRMTDGTEQLGRGHVATEPHCTGDTNSPLSWGEWLFGFPPSIYMTVSYLLGGIIRPTH